MEKNYFDLQCRLSGIFAHRIDFFDFQIAVDAITAGDDDEMDEEDEVDSDDSCPSTQATSNGTYIL